MALLGSTVDPRLFVQDYSGFTRAAEIQAQGMANLGGQIGSSIQKYGEAKAERKKLDAGIKATVTGIESAIKMGDSLGIDVKSSLTPYLDKINDPNTTPIEAAALAQQASNTISNVLNFGMKANELGVEEARYEAGVAAKSAELRAEAQKPIKLKRSAIKLGDETEVDVLEDDYGNVYDPQTKSRILDVPGFAKGLPLSQVAEQFDASGLPVAYGGEIPTETGEVLPSLARGNVPTLSADAQAAADIGGAIYPDGVPVEGTPIAGAKDQIAAASQIAAPVVSPASAQGIQTALDITTTQPQTITPRARQIKKEGFREFTPEEVVKYGSPGQINTKNNEVKLLSPPVGRSWKVSPDGTVEVIEGVGVGGGKAEAVKEAQKKQSIERFRGITGAAADSINAIKSELSANPVIALAQQGIATLFPASTVGRIEKNLETIKILNSKEAVNQARAASPTGSAGGNITENEWKIFQNNFGTLEVGMYPPDLASNLQKTSLNQFEAVNGKPENVIKLFNDGKITKPVFDEYIKEYKHTRSILGIGDAGTGGPGDDWTKYNPNLLRFDKEKQSQLSPEAQAMQEEIDRLKANQ